MPQFNAKLQPKFYTDKDVNYGDDVSKNYFAYMEKEYIKDGIIDSQAFHVGLQALNEEPGPDDGTPEFLEARAEILEANASIEETAFALWMAASYHGEDKIDWLAYFE